jgi:hypothetical protein
MFESIKSKTTIKKEKEFKMRPYSKIFHIGERFIENLFKGEVEITEKVDGSLWAMGINKNGQIVKRSKGQDLTFSDTPKMFKLANEQTERIAKTLKKKKLKNIYFYCEFLSKPKHNILTYEKVPKNNLYLFGVKEGENFVSDFDKLCEYADLLEIERPNLIYKGGIKDVKELEKLLDNNSCLGGTKIEGIVIKNYKQPVQITENMILPISMGKYVREDFKEKHRTDWGRNFTSKGRLEMLLENYKTEARWQKSIQHLSEKDKLENSPRDIGKLLVEIKKDILEEEEQNIKEELFKIFKDDILKKSVQGFAEFYKEYLAKKSIK